MTQPPQKKRKAKEQDLFEAFDESDFVEKPAPFSDVPKPQVLGDETGGRSGPEVEEEEGWARIMSGTSRPVKEKTTSADPAKYCTSSREYNKSMPSSITNPHSKTVYETENKNEKGEVKWEIGDAGSSWRMMKLRNLRTQATELKKDIEELAFEHYGSLRHYDEAREEHHEMELRKTRPPSKTKPTGDLYKERIAAQQREEEKRRKKDERVVEGIKVDAQIGAGRRISISELNVMKARVLKAQLMKSRDVDHLKAQYQAHETAYSQSPTTADMGGDGSEGEVIILPEMDSRGDPLSKPEEEMSIEELVREEKRTARQHHSSNNKSEAALMADKIARDPKFVDSLEYIDDNAERLASRRLPRKELDLKNIRINEFQKISRILEGCPLCHHESIPPIAPVIALATRTFLTLSSAPLVSGHCLIVPIQHHFNTLTCDDDEWSEIRNFKKCLTRMFHAQGCTAIFYENHARPYKRGHCAIECLPVPFSLADQLPRYFEEAILSSDEQWGQHRPLILTPNKTFRKRMSSEMAYFHIWFDLDGGLGHVVEDDGRWPRDDLFAREVLGSVLDVDVTAIRKRGRWDGAKESKAELAFKKDWKEFDWTLALIEH